MESKIIYDNGNIECIKLEDLSDILNIPKVLNELIIEYMKDIKEELDTEPTFIITDCYDFFKGIYLFDMFYSQSHHRTKISQSENDWTFHTKKQSFTSEYLKNFDINEYIIVPLKFTDNKDNFIGIKDTDIFRGFIWSLIHRKIGFTVYKNKKNYVYDDKISIRDLVKYFEK